MNEKSQKPSEEGTKPDSQPEGTERRYWIDEDGNVHGVVLSMEVDHFVEFTDQAIDLTPGTKDSDKPTA
jgi:uncharacterized protein YndB with AHSA1/START domain